MITGRFLKKFRMMMSSARREIFRIKKNVKKMEKGDFKNNDVYSLGTYWRGGVCGVEVFKWRCLAHSQVYGFGTEESFWN